MSKHISKIYLNGKRIATILICIIIALSAFASLSVSAAVQYEGEGTKRDPYIVKTPEQLDGMRNNLSAYYKLGANIDMKGYKSEDPTPKGNYAGGFVPIGMYSEPFTGTFTCDTDSNGNPIYTITNLSVTNDAGKIYGHKLRNAASYVDYVAGKSYWEAGLFGATEGANISNISITNVNIVNTVIGQHQMNSDWSINPGQDEQAAGGLVGIAKKSTITNCTVKGTISGANNFSGAICGNAIECVITNCTVDADLSTTGWWNCGGLAGCINDSTVNGCFVNANVAADSCDSPGIFSGTVTKAMLTDCYATGTITSGYTFAQLASAKNVINCYSAGTRKDGQTKSGNGNFDNSYILEGGYSNLLPAISQAELKQKFDGLPNWDTSGELPTIKHYVSSSNDVSTDKTSSETNDTIQEQSSDFTVLVNGIDVLASIKELPDAYNIEAEDYEYYIELYKAYMSMPVSLKADVSEETDTQIKEIGEVVSKEIIKAISEDIKALPNASKLTEKNKEALTEIVSLYKLIPSEFQSEMDADVYEKLCASLGALGMERLSIATASSSIVDYFSWFVIALNIILLAGTVVFVILLVKMYIRKKKTGSDSDDALNF